MMKGLCHSCFTSNIDIQINDGIILCENCKDTYKNLDRFEKQINKKFTKIL